MPEGFPLLENTCNLTHSRIFYWLHKHLRPAVRPQLRYRVTDVLRPTARSFYRWMFNDELFVLTENERKALYISVIHFYHISTHVEFYQ